MAIIMNVGYQWSPPVCVLLLTKGCQQAKLAAGDQVQVLYKVSSADKSLMKEVSSARCQPSRC